MEIGDVVVLKAGGPKMTVNWIDGVWITCVWFDDSNYLQTDKFHQYALRIIEQVSNT